MIFVDPDSGLLRHLSNSKLFDALDDYGIDCPILSMPGKHFPPEGFVNRLSFSDLARLSRDPMLDISRFGSIYFKKKLYLRISEFLE